MSVMRSVCVIVLLCCYQSQPGEAQEFLGNGLFFNNIMVVNHGIVTQEDIGLEAFNAVQCRTTVPNCCNDSDGNTGQWFFPNGSMVGLQLSSDIYQAKGPGYVFLHRQNMPTTEGIFRCEIRATGSEETYYVGVYPNGSGAVTINDPIKFTLDSAVNAATPMFTLTCTSTGGPATEVIWTLNDRPARGTESQTVIDTVNATYSNKLTVTGRLTGDYQCSVINDIGASIATQPLIVTEANPPTRLRATLDSNSSTITVSWTPPSPTPTGYVIYYVATDGGIDSGNVTVTGGSTEQFDITGRNRDSYDITIVATSDSLPSTVVGPVGTNESSNSAIAIGVSIAVVVLLIIGCIVIASPIFVCKHHSNRKPTVIVNIMPPEGHRQNTGSEENPREDQANNAEYHALRHCRNELIRGIQDPDSLADTLFSDSVIAGTVRDEVHQLPGTRADKNRRLLSTVESKVANEPETFELFITKLEEEPAHHILATRLKNSYNDAKTQYSHHKCCCW